MMTILSFEREKCSYILPLSILKYSPEFIFTEDDSRSVASVATLLPVSHVSNDNQPHRVGCANSWRMVEVERSIEEAIEDNRPWIAWSNLSHNVT